jgi:hypothetical protein
VKNKHAAAVQITAEQLLRESKERQIEYVAPVPKQNITDPQELEDFKLTKRKVGTGVVVAVARHPQWCIRPTVLLDRHTKTTSARVRMTWATGSNTPSGRIRRGIQNGKP